MIPSQILSLWVRGLLSIVLLVLGPILLYEWYQRAHVDRVLDNNDDSGVVSTQASASADATADPGRPGQPRTTRVFAPNWGLNGQTGLFAAGLLSTLWALPKGPLVPRRLLRRRGPDEPRPMRTGEVRTLTRP